MAIKPTNRDSKGVVRAPSTNAGRRELENWQNVNRRKLQGAGHITRLTEISDILYNNRKDIGKDEVAALMGSAKICSVILNKIMPDLKSIDQKVSIDAQVNHNNIGDLENLSTEQLLKIIGKEKKNPIEYTDFEEVGKKDED